ncbi:MAG: formate dehydrogenase accessory sulfurtransferase FdhD [Chloroflexota bacterium]
MKSDSSSTSSNQAPPEVQGTIKTEYLSQVRDQLKTVSGFAPVEAMITLYVNGKELIQLMATPHKCDELAVGFLYAEGLIDAEDDFLGVSLSPNKRCVDVLLRDDVDEFPRRGIITSGCGRGRTFRDHSDSQPDQPKLAPVSSDLRVSYHDLQQRMKEMLSQSELHRISGGTHSAALARTDQIIAVREDVGRHNAVDKLIGWTVINSVSTKDLLLLSSGRISSEMLYKAYRMQIPLVCSLTSPTSLSLSLAQEWNITLVGYLKGSSMRIYTAPERIITD